MAKIMYVVQYIVLMREIVEREKVERNYLGIQKTRQRIKNKEKKLMFKVDLNKGLKTLDKYRQDKRTSKF